MRREWRAGRVILAVLLLSLVGVGFYVWPRGPRWTIGPDRPMGFDLQRGLLFTTTVWAGKKDCELHGFDLVSGERKVSIPIPREAKDLEAHLWEMQTQLSPDCSKVATWGRSEPSIQVFDVRQQGRLLFKIRSDPLIWSSRVSFSPDGKLLAFRCLSEIEEVQIWDCTKGELKQTLKMPDGTTSGGGPRDPADAVFSRDSRYLAVGCDSPSYIVFDLSSEQVIGRCDKAWSALFLDDSSTLVTLPEPYHLNNLGIPFEVNNSTTKHIDWYRVEADQFHLMQKPGHGVQAKALFLDANPAALLTYHLVDNNPKRLPLWIPDGIRSKCEAALGWWMYHLLIESCHCETGEVRETFQIRVRSISNTKLSPDGQLLAIQEDTSLSLWDLPPRRSLTCWLSCFVFAAFVLWIGWPRRRRVSSMTA